VIAASYASFRLDQEIVEACAPSAPGASAGAW